MTSKLEMEGNGISLGVPGKKNHLAPATCTLWRNLSSPFGNPTCKEEITFKLVEERTHSDIYGVSFLIYFNNN